MKKIIVLFLAILCLSGLSGCYFHNEEMVFSEIKYYDLDGNEITGEYTNYFDSEFNNISLQLASNLKPLNSAAPIVNFYYAIVEDGTSIEVVMKFQKRVNDEFVSLVLFRQNDRDNLIEFTDNIEEIDGYFYVTYVVENITTGNNLFEVSVWTDQDGGEHYFSTRGGNTYIRGFYFHLNHQTIPQQNQ